MQKVRIFDMLYRSSSAARLNALDGLRVLLLEDDPLTAWHLAANLGKCGAVAYTPRRSALSADSLFEEAGMISKVDVAILDADLGTHTSETFARRLHASNVPFLFYTGDKSAVAGFLREHDVPVVEKPAHVDTIARTTLGLLASRRMSADA
ncbi:hypothetical protein [uncultured Jannaschia sp.]|uniref:hypothetical protein n=2 Tax=uncultured Jannaschia sp. TaxID=293347 RepID=UPI0026350A80|nr:hypothetical protein [uncultured Jannaschia sp.]